MSILHNHTTDERPSVSSATIAGGKCLNGSFEEACNFLKFQDDYPEIKGMSSAQKRSFMEEKQLAAHRKLTAAKRDLAKLEKEHARTEEWIAHIDEITDWMDSDLSLEKPSGPHFRDLRRSVAAGDTIYLHKDIYTEVPAQDYEKEIFRFAHVMVVEHDWANAFAHSNLGDTPIKLPYDLCAFEFQYSGRPVIVFATSFEESIAFCYMIKWNGLWTIPSFCSPIDGETKVGDISRQIRAICIALDAGIAYSEARREKTDVKQANNSQQVKDYNVVSLVQRTRAVPLASSASGKRVRLHFRRGHWRHLGNHKTWINWMLVGDPDLGFVDKHYRL